MESQIQIATKRKKHALTKIVLKIIPSTMPIVRGGSNRQHAANMKYKLLIHYLPAHHFQGQAFETNILDQPLLY